jgi:hypothetical protein
VASAVCSSRDKARASRLLFARENSAFLGLGSFVREANALAGLKNIHCGSSDAVETPGAQDTCSAGVSEAVHQSAHSYADLMKSKGTCVHGDGMNVGCLALLSRGAPGLLESWRGAHVKERLDMQRQTAMAGAAHWAACVSTIRTVWAARATLWPDFRCQYAGQVDAARGRIDAKQECLLRFLQMAADDGIVTPGPFGVGGFFGWSRFKVASGRAVDFRRGLEELFPAGCREGTLKETFLQTALIPERWQWEQGWRGGVPFVFRPKPGPGR